MKDMEVKKRGWVKNAAIVFLATMLVLTFFSNSIMNRSLPEVAAQYTTSGTITARIRGTGTVTANETFEVISNQTRTVNEVRVKLGDEVSVGDVLIMLSGAESDELAAAQDALRALELELERKIINTSLDGDYTRDNRNIQLARNKLADATRALAQINYSDAALAQAQAALTQAQSTLNTATTTWETRLAEFNAAESELEALKPPVGSGDPAEIEEAERKLANAEAALNAAADAVGAAQTAYNARQTEVTILLDNRDRWTMANELVKQLQLEVDNLVFELSETQKTDSVQATLTAIELRELRSQISEKQEEIEKLQGEGRNSEITSRVSGVVKAVNVTAGHQTEIGIPLMVIEVVDRGYSLSITVSAEQASKVSVGESAEVDRGYWSRYDDLNATLIGIRNDPQSPATNRILHFNVTGNVESGSQLNITIAQRSENYSIVVPKSAVRTDTNGDFVLIVESRQSPLGNRYIASRADVTVLASDDFNAAVTGGLTGWDFVILTASAPIEPGMQVRLADN